jgi:hypothetical protein
MKNNSKPRRVRDLSIEEMEALGQKLSRDYKAGKGVPLSEAEREAVERVIRGRGRPRIGKGAQRVMVSIEKELLERADSYARKQGFTRAQLIARGLRMALGSNGSKASSR